MGESAEERKFARELLRQYGVESLHLNVSGRRGWPDRIVPMPFGQLLWLEFKFDDKDPTSMQKYVHAYLRSAGHKVRVVRSATEAMDAFVEVSKEIARRN